MEPLACCGNLLCLKKACIAPALHVREGFCRSRGVLMQFRQLNLNLLIYLDALLAEKNVTRAASKIFLSQSAMSEALSQLREYFGDQLLISMAGKRTVLTPLAESLIIPVRDILLQIESLAMGTGNFQPSSPTRRLTIMASEYTTDVLLKKAVARLYKEAPGIQLEIRRLVPSCTEEIGRPELDLLIASGVSIRPDLPNEQLWEDTVVCVAWSKNHEVRDRIPMDKYLTTGHVSVRLDGNMASEYERWFENRFGKTLPVEVVVPEFSNVGQLIEGTNRIGTVPRRLAKVYAANYSLRLVEPPVEFPPFKEFIQWRKSQEKDSTLLWFRNFLKSLAAELK
jgi:DNA-binding transcriptional LysR family regulator